MRRIKTKRGLARAILNIVRQGDHYNQGTWISRAYFEDRDEKTLTGPELRVKLGQDVCGTTGCVAGNAAILTLGRAETYNWRYDEVVLANGEIEPVRYYAARVMGLTEDEADWLFNGDRPKDDVVEALEVLAAGGSISHLVESDED